MNSSSDEVYENIPCWNNGVWELVSYNSRQEFKDDLEQIRTEIPFNTSTLQFINLENLD